MSDYPPYRFGGEKFGTFDCFSTTDERLVPSLLFAAFSLVSPRPWIPAQRFLNDRLRFRRLGVFSAPRQHADDVRLDEFDRLVRLGPYPVHFSTPSARPKLVQFDVSPSPKDVRMRRHLLRRESRLHLAVTLGAPRQQTPASESKAEVRRHHRELRAASSSSTRYEAAPPSAPSDVDRG